MKNRKFAAISSGCMILTMIVTGCQGNATTSSDSANEAISDNSTVVSEDVAGGEEAAITQYDGYELLWNDEFDGDTLNEEIWNKELREPGWTNNELQEYTDSVDNIYLEDGCLVLQACKTQDENGNDYYTSGKVNSQNNQDFMYGKVVVRAKVPQGQGLWPAIWMMPTDESYYGQWPKCGEIDIMEVLGSQPNLSYATIHYGEPHAEQQGTYELANGTFADSFHDYSVEWEPGEMRFYVDDELVLTVNDWYSAVDGEEDKPYPAPFDQTFFVQMNLAVGGNWPGNPDETTDFENAKFFIDYVRVYQMPEYDTNVTKPEAEYREATEDGNLIYNGDFSDAEALDDEELWSFLTFNDGVGAAAIEDGVLKITTENYGTEDYSIQIVQPAVPMINGTHYQLTFEASASEDRDLIVCVSAPTAGWIRYLPDTTIPITTEWQTFTFDFDMTEKDDPNGRLEFNMGNLGTTADVYIRNVRIEVVE